MKKNASEENITQSLNELLMEVFAGIDYATKIAAKVHKSIPVVYRQLDTLVGFGLLAKKRKGKAVVYEINWDNLSKIVSASIFLDLDKIRAITNAQEHEKAIVAEIHELMGVIAPELFTDQAALRKIITEFFTDKTSAKFIGEFFKGLTENSQMKMHSLEETVSTFTDFLGMLDRQQLASLSKKVNTANPATRQFIAYCRLNFLQKKLTDPRTNLFKKLLA